jgi:hypothetical protein
MLSLEVVKAMLMRSECRDLRANILAFPNRCRTAPLVDAPLDRKAAEFRSFMDEQIPVIAAVVANASSAPGFLPAEVLTLPHDEIARLVGDGVERVVLSLLHPWMLVPTIESESEKDMLLSAKLDALQWVSLRQLGLDVNLDTVSERVSLAAREISRLATRTTPSSVLSSIVRCVRFLSSAFADARRLQMGLPLSTFAPASAGPDGKPLVAKREQGNDVAVSEQMQVVVGADDMMPLLVYALIRGRPDRLHSTLQFVQRFGNPDRLSVGESAYYFTSLWSAAAFIENMDARALNVDPEEYAVRAAPTSSNATNAHPLWRSLDSLPDWAQGARDLRHALAVMIDVEARAASLARQLDTLELRSGPAPVGQA